MLIDDIATAFEADGLKVLDTTRDSRPLITDGDVQVRLRFGGFVRRSSWAMTERVIVEILVNRFMSEEATRDKILAVARTLNLLNVYFDGIEYAGMDSGDGKRNRKQRGEWNVFVIDAVGTANVPLAG